jgi:hypothetical protein
MSGEVRIGTPSVVYETLWRFAAERQAVYMRRLSGADAPWTEDPIIQSFRFTNAYRATDRVSQYLIRRVIYEGDRAYSPEDLVFRIMLFKLFNRIPTWELLERRLGSVDWQSYRFDVVDRVLSDALSTGQRIYSAAYVVPPMSVFGHRRKHRNHLRLLESIMSHRVTSRLARCGSLAEVFHLLLSYPGFGPFLAYQFAIDLNYSELIDFSEMEFVVPGPGARDGIRKCFPELESRFEADIVRRVADLQTEEFERRGLTFDVLWGRNLQLVDCQNLFCEIDKYARVAHPSIQGLSGRTRIKQRYDPGNAIHRPFFPPKWGLNERVRDPVMRPKGRLQASSD